MDSPGNSGQIIILILCIFGSAFFSSTETAFMSINKMKLKNLVKDEKKGAEKVQNLIDNPSKLLSTILLGNNFVNIAASSLATSLAINIAGNNSMAITVSTTLLTIVLLIFAEITPKTFATVKAEPICFAVSGIISFLIKVFAPIVFLLSKISNVFIVLLGVNGKDSSPTVTEAEFKTIVDVGHEEGVFETEERTMINNVVNFGDRKAQDIMTPRTEMIAISHDLSYKEILEIFQSEQFTRLPVYKETTDNILGIINLKDIMFHVDDEKKFVIDNFLRGVYFTYQSKSTSELFSVMRAKKIPLSIVLDEYGGTCGLITLEDLIEEIVGDISDEHDVDITSIRQINELEFLVDGSTKIEDVNEIIGVSIESEDYDSIGGYILGLVGHVPDTFERLQDDFFEYVVLNVAKNRVTDLRLIKKPVVLEEKVSTEKSPE